jgi:hypothetical protein
MHMFNDYKHLKPYLDQIDKTRYMDLQDNNNCFYWKYRNAGYSNPKAKYWHHDEIPHEMYSHDLYNFYVNKYNVGT